MTFIKIIQIIFLSLLLTSCNKEDEISKDAISVFFTDFTPKIDQKLENKEIKLPKQIKNNNFNGIFYGNSKKAENFALNNQIKKIKKIRNGYVTSSRYDMISNPIIWDNIIYALDARGNLSARNLEDNKLIYRKRIINWLNIKNLSQGKIFYDQDKIYITTGFNEVVAVRAKDADIIWSKKLASIPISRPIIHADNLYLISNDNKTYALNKENGNIKWVHNGIIKKTVIFGSADPVIYKNQIISAYSSGEVYILDQETAAVADFYELNANRAISSNFILDDIDAAPIIRDDILYIIGNGDLMIAVNLENKRKLWQKNLSSISNFWLAADFIYLIDNENRLICLYRKTGTIKFFKQLEKYYSKNKFIHYFGLILAGDNLILTNSNKEMLLISPFDGEISKKYKFSKKIQHRPIISNQRLYLHLKGRFDTDLLIFQ